jgi:hypothetical protein
LATAHGWLACCDRAAIFVDGERKRQPHVDRKRKAGTWPSQPLARLLQTDGTGAQQE